VAGTGLYYLRNMNVAGIEGTGWPKFTGGWLFATPAIGDSDGDGQLEVTALTREGFAFSWDTDRPACGTNDEWWTSRHDEWNTGAYGTDSRPPGTPTQLAASPNGSSVQLTWKAPGDDWLCGAAQQYRILRSSSPIEHPEDGTVVGDFSAGAVGSTESRTISATGSDIHFAVFYKDEAGNWGRLATTSVGYARPKGATPFRTSLVPAYQQCTSANRVHGAPLAHPSCAPPVQQSPTLTVGTPDANGSLANSTGALRLDVNAGDPSTPTDEADVGVSISLTDVRCAGTTAACPSGQGSDYAGRLLARTGLRITDRYNGPGQDENGTVVETDLEMPFTCSVTAGTGTGGSCALNTTLDSLVPGAVVEGKRAIWQLGAVTVSDAGPNGTGYGGGCPSTCGDGDEAVFMRQGIFIP
jgi:hypothetical protein